MIIISREQNQYKSLIKVGAYYCVSSVFISQVFSHNYTHCISNTDTMTGNFILNTTTSDTITSADGTIWLTVHEDGNFCLYLQPIYKKVRWCFHTEGAPLNGDNYISLQQDGNLVLYDSNNLALWETGTPGNTATAPHKLCVANCGLAYIVNNNNMSLWYTRWNWNVWDTSPDPATCIPPLQSFTKFSDLPWSSLMRFKTYNGMQCEGTQTDILRDYPGNEKECKLKCVEINECTGFVRLSDLGKCYFRAGIISEPVAYSSDSRDCYVLSGTSLLFGFEIATNNKSTSSSMIIVTLYLNALRYQCRVQITAFDTYYACNTTTTECVTNPYDSVKYDYALQIDHVDSHSAVNIDKIIINDSNNDTFIVDYFCLNDVNNKCVDIISSYHLLIELNQSNQSYISVMNESTDCKSCANFGNMDNNTCTYKYIFVASEKSWDDANDFCQDEYGTTLATIITDKDLQISNHIKQNVQNVDGLWIGLTSQYFNKWVWIDGTSCNYVDTGDCADDDHWYQGEPNNDDGMEYYGTLVAHGLFNNVPILNVSFLCNNPAYIIKPNYIKSMSDLQGTAIIVGFETATVNKSQHLSMLTLRLYLNALQYQCYVNVTSFDTYYECDTSNINRDHMMTQCAPSNSNQYNYALQIEYQHFKAITIDRIIVKDTENNFFSVEYFYDEQSNEISDIISIENNLISLNQSNLSYVSNINLSSNCKPCMNIINTPFYGASGGDRVSGVDMDDVNALCLQESEMVLWYS